MYLRLLNGEENHAKEVAGRLKEKENIIYNTHSRKKGTDRGLFLKCPVTLLGPKPNKSKSNQNLNN